MCHGPIHFPNEAPVTAPVTQAACSAVLPNDRRSHTRANEGTSLPLCLLHPELLGQLLSVSLEELPLQVKA